LFVPAIAKRVTPIEINTVKSYKSRVEYGKVLEIVDKDGKTYDKAYSFVFKHECMAYTVNEIVRANKFDPDPNNEFTCGIHVQRYKDQCDIWAEKN